MRPQNCNTCKCPSDRTQIACVTYAREYASKQTLYDRCADVANLWVQRSIVTYLESVAAIMAQPALDKGVKLVIRVLVAVVVRINKCGELRGNADQ